MANCILCNHEGNQIGTTELFSCPVCHTNFSKHTEPASYENYEILYPGIKDWCESLKSKPNAWRQAANRGVPYQKIIEYFMNQDQQISILDVGCGYGYMVYILNQLGFKARGTDISREAISFALKTYSPKWYDLISIEDYQDKHDMVVAVEVFEHVANPKEWLKRCLEIAPKIMITTPNLSAYSNQNWVSEEPPIHMACYRKKSLEWLANDLGIKVEIDDSSLNLIATFYG